MVSSDDKIKEIDAKISEVDKKIQELLATADEGWSWNKSYGRIIRINVYTSEKSAFLTEKSAILTKDLTASVDRLHQSSNRLELFTFALIGITVFLGLIAVIELVKDLIPKFVLNILAFIFLIVIAYIIYILKKTGNKMISQK